MDKLLRRGNSIVLLVGIISLVIASVSGFRWWQQANINDYINGKVETTASTHPHVRFYQATLAEAEEDRQKARDIYTILGTENDIPLRGSAYYNRGNVNLNYALILPENHPKRLPLVELAKQDYRTALRFTPNTWEIRYNLALALRQIPEGPVDLSQNPKGAPIEQDREIETVDFTSELP